MTGEATPEFGALAALLKARHSCRGFLPAPVPRPTIEKILATAQRVPSWCNAQPWQLIVTSGTETERLREALLAEATRAEIAPDIPFPAVYEGVYRERRSDCGWRLYNAVGVARGDRAGSAAQMRENFRFFGAPHVALVTAPAALGTYGVLDIGGYVTAFALAAQALGVASIPQAAVAAFSPFLHRYFAIPEDRWIVCAISFGFEDREHPANGFRTDRASPDEAVTWRG